MRLTREAIKNSLEGCKRTFNVTLAGLTPEGIELLTTVMFGELNAELQAVDRITDDEHAPEYDDREDRESISCRGGA